MTTAPSRPDHAREVKYALTDVRSVCEQLGIITDRASFTRQAGGLIIRCPWHAERTPSCSIRLVSGQIAVKCHGGCGKGGDVLSLIAQANGLSTARDFREVLRIGAEMAGLWDIVSELDGKPSGVERVAFVAPPPEPEREYPPFDDVQALVASCVPVTEDAEVSAYLEGRAVDPEMVEADRLAYALPENSPVPGHFATYKGLAWSRTGHRLILPVRDATGATRSLRAWRVKDGDSPKRLPPGGYKASGLVLASPLAVAFLSGLRPAERVLFVEGESDFLVAATWRLERPTAVIGVASGSWTPAFGTAFRPGTEVLIWTDRDRAGDAYADEIIRSLAPRGCRVGRWRKETP
jgi:DNA primase